MSAIPIEPRIIGLALLLACTTTAAGPGIAAGEPPRLELRHASFDPLVGAPPLPGPLRWADEPTAGYFLVQFHQRITPPDLAALSAAGASPLSYVPNRAYLVRLTPGAAARVRALPRVRWLGPFQPGWKLAPDLGRRPYRDSNRRTGGRLYATLDLFPGEDLRRTADRVAATGAEVLHAVEFSDTRRLKVRATSAQLERAARLEAVAWIEEAAEIELRNDTAHWVVQTDTLDTNSVWDHGLHGEGQIVGHIDGPIDMTSCYFSDAVDNTPGPAHRKVVAYRSSTGPGADRHGTHVAGTMAGDPSPSTANLDDAGHAYAARISHTNVGDIQGSGASPSNLYDNLVAAHQDGARVHGNSWGDDGTTAYTTWSRDIDRFSYDYEDSLVLFAVTNQPTLRTPENAKNVLAVAASQNGLAADNYCSGGVGPTSDGRRKPEIVAPGCDVQSAGEALGCGTRVLSGTSMACPAVTGAAALVRQYYQEGWYPTGSPQTADARNPSGALIKATLINSAVDMTGLAGFPGDREGWGRLLLENALFFAGDTRAMAVLADVRNVNGLSTGANDVFALDVTGSSEPLEITLVYTEPPAVVFAGAATVNDLDLEVQSPGGQVYHGNVFDLASGISIPGGAPDSINNVESFLLPAPEAGEWLVIVRGAAVNQGTQGYALVATGQVGQIAGGSLRYFGSSIDDSGPLGNGDGAADPGETVSVPLSMVNVRPSTSTGVSAKLFSADDGVLAVTRGQAQYPDMAPDAVAESLPPHFQVTLAPTVPCGTLVPLRLRSFHAEGGNDSTFTLRVGSSTVQAPAQDTPLALPTASATPATSTIDIDDPFTVGDLLVSVVIRHQDVSELTVRLISPLGTGVTLHDGGGDSPDIDTTYDSETSPSGPGSLADFDGESAQGTWTLSVLDNVIGIPITPAGTLESWSLTVSPGAGGVCEPLDCGGDPVPSAVPPTVTVAPAGGADLRLSWAAVPGAAGYRVWRTAERDLGQLELVGVTSSTELVDAGARGAPASWYYRVRAINSCEWEGP